jgi:hypothetical protein
VTPRRAGSYNIGGKEYAIFVGVKPAISHMMKFWQLAGELSGFNLMNDVYTVTIDGGVSIVFASAVLREARNKARNPLTKLRF